MKNKLFQTGIFLFVYVVLVMGCKTKGALFTEQENERQLLENWQMLSTTQTNEVGEGISINGFVDTSSWIRAKVPTSVLGALVAAEIYPDPHFDLNDLKIPDASDDLSKRLGLNKYSYLEGVDNPFKDPYWFRTSFKVPSEQNGRRVWLNFDGINYRADLWVNGHQIADSSEMAGMFLRFKYDITDFVSYDAENIVAVRIHQVDHVGDPVPGYLFEPFGFHRGQGSDIFKDVTLKFMAGWDCAPVVRDRNMGIYQDVYLNYTDDVKIIDPYIVTDLNLPDTTKAIVAISAELQNAGKESVKGILKGSIDLLNEIDFVTYKRKMPGEMSTIHFEKEVEIPAGEKINVAFNNEEFKQLEIENPHLWWPNGYGMQYLHNLNLSFEIDGKTSDSHNTMFGIRQITSTLNELDGEYGRVFWVNGKRIFSQGGWIQPDMMLNFDKKRIYDEARLLAEANVNMIGNEDMPSPPESVMETYDKYGLLMWETFFQCWTSYPGTPSFNNPTDTKLALRNMFDVVKRYRNNASLVLWCTQNETMVREELYVPLRKFIAENDPSRPFVATSSYGWDVEKLTPYILPDLPTGMTDEGTPDYTWYPHEFYYNKILEVKQQMFRNELGVPAVSTLRSMEKYIFNLGEGPKNDIYPLDSVWAYHDAWDTVPGENYAYKMYDQAIRNQFGQPETAAEYIRWAQYINAGSYRAMYEAANHRMWDITTGIMLWKLNATWPQVLWQIYDWFHNPNAGYYFTKKALAPVHIQMNEHNRMVSIINKQHKSLEGYKASIKVYDYDLTVKWEKDADLTLGEDQFKELFVIPKPDEISPVYFIKLELKDGKGNVVADNFYWVSADGNNDFRELTKLPKIDLKLTSDISSRDDEKLMTVKIKNTSDQLAFMHRLIITKGEKGEEVWPTFWSDNFITLFPGEEKTVTARFATEDLKGHTPFLSVDKNQ